MDERNEEAGVVVGVDDISGFSETPINDNWSVVKTSDSTNCGRMIGFLRDGKGGPSCEIGEGLRIGMMTEWDDNVPALMAGS